MRNKAFKAMWNLQLFTEGDGSGADGGNGGGTGNDGNATNLSFDDFLKLEGNQSEFDRRVNSAVNTAVSNAREKWRILTDDKVSEAEKLANMTAEEKQKYENDKLKKELEAFKRKDSLAAMSKTARKILEGEEITIPDELLTCLVTESADDTKKNVESFAKLFKEAVLNGVKEKLKGKSPKGGGSSAVTKEQIFAIKDPEERQKMIAENMNLFE